MKKKINWKLALVLLLAFGLRLIYLNQSLWLDEGIEWWAVTTFNLKQLLFGFMSGDFNPLAHYLLMWFWVRVFGDSEISLRMPSVLFGMGTVWFIYKIANLTRPDLARQGQAFANLAAGLAAVNSLLIYYSQEARAYAMAAFLVTGAMYFLIKGKKLGYLGYLILMTLAMYSHYLIWLLLPFLAIAGIQYLLPLALTIPWWPMVWRQLQIGQMVSQNTVWAKIGETNWQNIGLVIIKFITGRVSFPESLILAGIVILISISIWFLIIKNVLARKDKIDLILALWGFGPLILGALIGIKIPIFIYFRFIFVLPALILLLAKGINGLKGKMGIWIKYGLIVIYSSFSLLYLFNPNYHRENWKGAIAELHKLDDKPTVIIHPAVRPPFDYYDRNESTVLNFADLRLTINDLPSVWYFPYAQPIFDSNDKTREMLFLLGLERVYEKHFNGVTLEKWAKNE